MKFKLTLVDKEGWILEIDQKRRYCVICRTPVEVPFNFCRTLGLFYHKRCDRLDVADHGTFGEEGHQHFNIIEVREMKDDS